MSNEYRLFRIDHLGNRKMRAAGSKEFCIAEQAKLEIKDLGQLRPTYSIEEHDGKDPK